MNNKVSRRKAIGLMSLFGLLQPGLAQEILAQPGSKNDGQFLVDATRRGQWQLDISGAKSFTVIKGDRKVTFSADEVMDALLGEGRFGDIVDSNAPRLIRDYQRHLATYNRRPTELRATGKDLLEFETWCKENRIWFNGDTYNGVPIKLVEIV